MILVAYATKHGCDLRWVVDPTRLRFPLNRLPATDARDWEAIRSWAGEAELLAVPVGPEA